MPWLSGLGLSPQSFSSMYSYLLCCLSLLFVSTSTCSKRYEALLHVGVISKYCLAGRSQATVKAGVSLQFQSRSPALHNHLQVFQGMLP